MCAYQPGFEKKKTNTILLRVFVEFVVSRHEVFVRFRLCPLSAHDEDGDIGGEAGQASREPREILRDVDDVTTVHILPSLEAIDAHDGGDLCGEHLLNLRHSLQLWGNVCLHHSKKTYTCTCVPRASQNSHVESGIRALRIRSMEVPLTVGRFF